jgi:hypothetical protein
MEEHDGERAEEELLRVVLGRITPPGSNPRRIQEIRRRVTVRRRRRVAMAGVAALAVATAVTAHIWGSSPARDRTVANSGVSWAAPGFTELPLSGLPGGPSAGWHTVLRPDGKPGTPVVAAYSPRADAAPLTPVVEGGALVFYVQTEAGAPRAAVRRLDRIDDWCEQAGGTQELIRIAHPADEGHTARNAYACLNNASQAVIQQTTEILATAILSH